MIIEHREAVKNIKARIERNYATHFCNELDSPSFRALSKTAKRKALQQKTHLTTFSQSNTYERFLILQAFVSKKTYLSEALDKIISKVLESAHGGLNVSDKTRIIDKHIDQKIQHNLKDVIKSEVVAFVDMLQQAEASTISEMLQEEASCRRQGDSFESSGRYAVYSKLTALAAVIDEYINEKSNEGQN